MKINKSFLIIPLLFLSFLISKNVYATTDNLYLSNTVISGNDANLITTSYLQGAYIDWGVTDKLDSITLYCKNSSMHICVATTPNADGSGCIAYSETKTLTTSKAVTNFDFITDVSLSNGTRYYFLLKQIAGGSQTAVERSNASYLNEMGRVFNGAVYSTEDLYIRVYSAPLPPPCGDGDIDAGEECDDGNTTNGDGCSSTCQNEYIPGCGSGQIDEGEECDDGNTTSYDGCSAICTTESTKIVNLIDQNFYDNALTSSGLFFVPFGKFIALITGFFLSFIIVRKIIKMAL